MKAHPWKMPGNSRQVLNPDAHRNYRRNENLSARQWRKKTKAMRRIVRIAAAKSIA